MGDNILDIEALSWQEIKDMEIKDLPKGAALMQKAQNQGEFLEGLRYYVEGHIMANKGAPRLRNLQLNYSRKLKGLKLNPLSTALYLLGDQYDLSVHLEGGKQYVLTSDHWAKASAAWAKIVKGITKEDPEEERKEALAAYYDSQAKKDFYS